MSVRLELPSARWSPRAQVSPSQISVYQMCPLRWAFRYCLGIKEVGTDRGRMLGTMIHACEEEHMCGRPMAGFRLQEADQILLRTCFTPAEQAALIAEAPARAIAGIHLLPVHSDCERVDIERWVNFKADQVDPAFVGVSLNGKKDLAVTCRGTRYLYDHKSTRGSDKDPWLYVPTAADLRVDVQPVIYATDEMLSDNLDFLACRWVYYATGPKHRPQAKAVDFCYERAELMDLARGWLATSAEMIGHVRAFQHGLSTIENLTGPNPPKAGEDRGACDLYGRDGCPYQGKHGGPCKRAAQTLTETIMGDLFAPETTTTTEIREMNPLQPPEATTVMAPPGAAMAPPQAAPVAQVAQAAPVAQVAQPPLPAGWGWVQTADGRMMPVENTQVAPGAYVGEPQPGEAAQAPQAAPVAQVAPQMPVAAQLSQEAPAAQPVSADKPKRGRPAKKPPAPLESAPQAAPMMSPPGSGNGPRDQTYTIPEAPEVAAPEVAAPEVAVTLSGPDPKPTVSLTLTGLTPDQIHDIIELLG